MCKQTNQEALQFHLQTLQNIIARMASNSNACKGFCITIVSAILVLIADKNQPKLISITFIPIIMFYILDSYYLSFERNFRDIYVNFVKKIHLGTIENSDMYSIPVFTSPYRAFFSSLFSFSTIAFYAPLNLLIWLVEKHLNL